MLFKKGKKKSLKVETNTIHGIGSIRIDFVSEVGPHQEPLLDFFVGACVYALCVSMCVRMVCEHAQLICTVVPTEGTTKPEYTNNFF